ncbi:hypothetical protein NIES22_49010 [Calothrix brevissima NIES-22]|nr:hypothetical protein NIES22_49010 [Calothrix brevissima NIES-22]
MKSKLSKNQTLIQQNNSKVIHLSDLNELTNQEAEMVTGGWLLDIPGSGGGDSGGGNGSGGGIWCVITSK